MPAAPWATPLLVLPLLLAGCVHPLVSRDSVPVPAGAWAEVNLHLRIGDTITWTWSTTQASPSLHFNVHNHPGGTVRELVIQDGSGGHGSFTAPQAGPYSLFWQNAGNKTSRLTYAVNGAALVDSVLPE